MATALLLAAGLLATPPALPPEGRPVGLAPTAASAELGGRVEGPAGAGFDLADVVVELDHPGFAQAQRVRLDLRGEFQFPSLVPGDYTLRVRHAGRVVERPVSLAAGVREHLEIELEPAPAPADPPAPAPAPVVSGAPVDDGQTLRRAGLGVTVLGVVLGIGGAIVAFHNPCGRDGARGSNCETDLRNTVALTLGVASLGTLAGGVSSMAVGQSLKNRERLRRADLGFALRLDRGGGGLVLLGRF